MNRGRRWDDTSSHTSDHTSGHTLLVAILVVIHNTQGRRWDDADLVGCFRGQPGGAEAARWPRVDDHIHHSFMEMPRTFMTMTRMSNVHDDDCNNVEGRPGEVRQLWQHGPPPLRSQGFHHNP